VLVAHARNPSYSGVQETYFEENHHKKELVEWLKV
jgi:hypothetical protein